MANGVFTVAVVTPEARLLASPASALVLRSSDGFLTVLDGHTPIVTDVVPCDVRVDTEEGDAVHLAVHGGYLQVETGHLADDAAGRAAGEDPATAGGAPEGEWTTRATLLAGVAELAGDIDIARAEAARAAAQATVDELAAQVGKTAAVAEGEAAPTTPEALRLAEAQAALARAQLRLEVAGAVPVH